MNKKINTKLPTHLCFLRRNIFTLILFSLSYFSNAVTINSIADGSWNNSSVWSSGTVPGVNDDVVIHHNINLNVNTTVNKVGLDTHKLKAGMYLIQIQLSGVYYFEKLMVE